MTENKYYTHIDNKFDPKTGKGHFIACHLGPKFHKSIIKMFNARVSINRKAQSKKGNMTIFKLAEYDLETGNLKGYIEPKDNKKNQARCFYLDRDNSLFVGTNFEHGGGGGVRFEPAQDKKDFYDNGRYVLIKQD